ncbi:hypothetical protein [Swingsia samuiensis]|uniref:Uncharacterized protein n=1 Tax=Swingsia samuiensis TaxID=1293412 RepID=A0A4Y6ULY8_9PROT|nr:hypothetical protein [Swingsia samuiensis]QDH17411.1 hypothetical protein E3D00_07410 [Swingsia samuiensis]
MIAPVNGQIQAVLKVTNGYTVNDDFSKTPNELEISVMIEVQAMSTSDLRQVQNINQQSDMRAVYIRGGIKGLNRPLQTGGDILHFYGSDWKVVQVLEEWGMEEWTKLVVSRQITRPRS